LELVSGSPVVGSTLRGLVDRWDEVEQSGTDVRQVASVGAGDAAHR